MSNAAPLPPNSFLGLLGGGQLGRMFTHAAQSLGYKVCVLDPDADSPAGAVADQHLHAAYLDETALDAMAARCRAVTTEFENVPAAAMERLERHCAVAPAGRCVAIAQDRVLEKRFIAQHGVPVAPHAVIEKIDDFANASPQLFPAILKTARLGYDGKGQVTVDNVHDAREAWVRLGRVACVLEKKLPLRQEVSCVVCRAADGRSATFPVSENEHRGGILAVGDRNIVRNPGNVKEIFRLAADIRFFMHEVSGTTSRSPGCTRKRVPALPRKIKIQGEFRWACFPKTSRRWTTCSCMWCRTFITPSSRS